jgi:mevalonate kinase
VIPVVQASEARAPGKVILLGEHAVVYGQPAIALPLDRGVTVRCVPAERFHLATRPEVGAAALDEALGRLAQALDRPKVAVHIQSELPLSAGLGSSAAVAVASARALTHAAGRALSDEALLSLAEGMEQTFHGRPSGIDHTTCLRAVPLRFQRGEPNRVEALRVPRFEFVVASAGPRIASTREKVLGLRAEWERDPRRLDPLFAQIGALVDAGAAALARADAAELGRLMNANQELLRALEVSTPAIDALIAKLRDLGARGAKLTGAGGGGAVLAIHDEPSRLVRELEAAGHPAFAARWEEA